MADWAAQNGIKKVVTMVSDYAPGHRRRRSPSTSEFTAKGGEILETDHASRWPIPISRRSCSARPTHKPDAIFVFVPSGQGGTFVKQFVERGLDKAGIKIIGPGDVTDDDLLNGMGDAVHRHRHRAYLFGRSQLAR